MPDVWTVDTIYIAVHKLSYFKIKAQVKIQVFPLCSRHHQPAQKTASGISLHILPSDLPQLLKFSQHCDCFQSNYVLFSSSYSSIFFYYQSPSSLYVWKMVVKFLCITVVLLIIQSWKDAAASQLR